MWLPVSVVPGTIVVSSLGKDVLLRRTTLDRVIPREGRITIASLAVIAPAPMLAVTLPPKVKCTVNWAVVFRSDVDCGHAAANIAGQSQIARLD